MLELSLYLKSRGGKIIQVGIDCEDGRKSRFNIAHEALFRYWHLLRCWRLIHSTRTWFHSVPEEHELYDPDEQLVANSRAS